MQALCGCPALHSERVHSDWEGLCSRLLHGAAPARGSWPVQPTCQGSSVLLQGALSSCRCSSVAAVSCMLQHQHCMTGTGIHMHGLHTTNVCSQACIFSDAAALP